MAYDSSETCFEHIGGSDICSVTASEQWSVNMINKMKAEHPDDVKIMHTNPDGSMVAHVPFRCMQYFRFPNKRDMTEEQRQAQIERGKRLGANRKKMLKKKHKNSSENDEDENEENEENEENKNENGDLTEAI